jgi:acyl-CoA synthetase (AMP-forming)/AMP-acid ligase II
VADGFASAIVAAGLGPGARIAVLAKNCLAYPALYLGAAKAGAVLVPINFRLVPNEWIYIVNDAGAQALVVGPEYVDDVVAYGDDLKSVEHFVSLGATAPVGWAAFDSWIDARPPLPLRRSGTDDVIIQMYTSGTTGLPKGVLITQGSTGASLAQMSASFLGLEQSRVLVVTPMYHIAAALSCLQALSVAGSLLLYNDFVPQDVVRALDEEGIGLTFLAPAMIQALLTAVPDVADRSYESLRLIAYGASPISEDTLRRAMDVFGCEFVQGFGQTEASGGLTLLSAVDHRRALSGDKPELLRSCGQVIPATQVKIVDQSGSELPPYESGEILASGPQVMRGYWNLPEATEEALCDGWLHTGDAGYLDDEGFLYLRDRVRDIIVTGGENVYPAEIEQSLFAHPGIADAAVIGIPDQRWGESVHAVVQLRPDSTVTEQEIIEFCHDRMAGFKRPRSVSFVDVMPRNASMKVLKRELRAPYWEGTDRAVN